MYVSFTLITRHICHLCMYIKRDARVSLCGLVSVKVVLVQNRCFLYLKNTEKWA